TKGALLSLLCKVCTSGNIAVISGLQCVRFNLSEQEFKGGGYFTAKNYAYDEIHLALPERFHTKLVPPQIIPLTSKLHKAYMDLIDREAEK
ncbi:hypothetical protein LCGC14_2930090, partial [marine sediment metagenome]